MRRRITSSSLAVALVVLVAASVRGTEAGPEVHDPRQFPSCPDIASIAIAYRDALMKQATTLRPESLLYGPTSFWPVARENPDCDGSLDVTRVTFLLNYTPIAPDASGRVFAVDIGTGLGGNLARLEIVLRDRKTGAWHNVERTIWTLDASVRRTQSRFLGEILEEADYVWGGPPDRLTLPIVARDAGDRHVLDIGQDELSFFERSNRLPGDAVIGFEPPDETKPLRLLLALDLSSFLVRKGSGATFSPRYGLFVNGVVLQALQKLDRSLRKVERSAPIELGIVRYAQTGQWLEQPFWRIDEGLSEQQYRILRGFLLEPPPPTWKATGQADADGAINAMKELWHYFEGMRAVVVIPRGKDVLLGRRTGSFAAPGSDDVPGASRRELEALARRLEQGDTVDVGSVLQHTERRNPMIYALMPLDPPVEGRLGYAWLRRLIDMTGGTAFARTPANQGSELVDCLLSVIEDLSHGYLATVEIPNDAQEAQWKVITVRTTRPHVKLRAPNLYRSSGSLCRYLPSYLVNRDPLTRLVAAGEASSCWKSQRVDAAVEGRLLAAGREEEPLVHEELFRSFVEMKFRQLQASDSSKKRRSAYKQITEPGLLSDVADPLLVESYRAIARQIRGR